MAYNKENYPSGTLLSQLYLDVYANKKSGEVTILYDTELTESLIGIEYHKDNGDLLFVFEPGRIPLGDTIEGELAEFILEADKITMLHVDMQTKEPMSGMEVPLKVI